MSKDFFFEDFVDLKNWSEKRIFKVGKLLE